MVTSATADWSVRARSAALGGGAFVSDFESATLVERVNAPDTLQLKGRTDDLRPLFALDGGCTVSDASGRRFAGPLSSLERNGDGTSTLTFESDLIRLWERDVYPTPTADIEHQSTDVGHVLSGPAETVLLTYVAVNAGPSALAARRVAHLTVPTSLGRGGTITRTSRLDVLGQLVADIATPAGLRVTVQQVGTDLAVAVAVLPNLTSTARYGTPDAGGPGLLDPAWSYTLTKPDVTAALVCGGGEGTVKQFRERIDTAAQAAWGRRVEGIVEQSQTRDLTELDKAGDDALAAGAQPVTINAPILDSPDLRLGVDVPLGALVALDLDGARITERLRQLTTSVTAAGVQVSGVVATPDGNLTRSQKEFLAMRAITRTAATR